MRFIILDAAYVHMMIGLANGKARSKSDIDLVNRLDRIGLDVSDQTRNAHSTTVVISEEIANLIGINSEHYKTVAVVI